MGLHTLGKTIRPKHAKKMYPKLGQSDICPGCHEGRLVLLSGKEMTSMKATVPVSLSPKFGCDICSLNTAQVIQLGRQKIVRRVRRIGFHGNQSANAERES